MPPITKTGKPGCKGVPCSRRQPAPKDLDRARDRAAAAPMRRELALALARAGQTEEARQVLSELLISIPPDAELLGLVGRINKDLAWRSASAEEGRAHLQSALAFYLDGYRRDGDAYCGINAASLHTLLGDRDLAATLAAEVLDRLGAEEAFWQSAIRGEASLLLGRVDEARQHYTKCAVQGVKRHEDVRSVWTQARRLSAALHGDPGLVDECFDRSSPEPEPLTEQLQALAESLVADTNPATASDLPALGMLARELLRVQEEQRHALSRELHDNIAQLLTATTTRIALAREEVTSKKLKRELAEVKSVAEQALQAVSDLSRNLRPSLIDQMALPAAIEKHAAAFRDRMEINLHLHIDAPSAAKLNESAATHLFRIVQEALHNVEKHAQATEAHIRLLEEDKLLRLEIADNGCSFTPEHAEAARHNGHLGLISMRERAEMLGGTFEIEAQHGNGTRVRAHVPLRN